VKNAQSVFEASVAEGATPVLEPTFVPTHKAQKNKGATLYGCYIAEVELYGDAVLRYISYSEGQERHLNLPFLPHLAPAKGSMSK
jgi:hypothetical protein